MFVSKPLKQGDAPAEAVSNISQPSSVAASRRETREDISAAAMVATTVEFEDLADTSIAEGGEQNNKHEKEEEGGQQVEEGATGLCGYPGTRVDYGLA